MLYHGLQLPKAGTSIGNLHVCKTTKVSLASSGNAIGSRQRFSLACGAATLVIFVFGLSKYQPPDKFRSMGSSGSLSFDPRCALTNPDSHEISGHQMVSAQSHRRH